MGQNEESILSDSLEYSLFKIQQDLRAPKAARNDFGNYNYRTTESILSAVKPLLDREECFCLLKDELVSVDGRFYIKATAELYKVGHLNSVSVTAFARESLSRPKFDEAQLTGAASSYARKYALCGLFSIDNALDHDVINKGYHEEPEKNFDNYVFASGPLKGRSLNLVNDSEALQRVLTLSGAKMPEGLHIAISKRIFEIESESEFGDA